MLGNTGTRSLLIFLTIVLSTHFFPTSAPAQESITIGLLPEMNVFKQKKRFEPLAAYLAQKTGVEIKLTILSRYGNIIERLKEEQIDAAFLGSFTGALAISQLGVEPLARPVNMDGTSSYYGHIFVRKDSGIKTAADMKGKTLALVERATTAGYVFPLAWLQQQGVADMSSYLKEYYFAGSHDATIDAVLNGRADIGAGKNTIYERIRQTNPRVDRELEIIANSPRVPSNGLCVRSGLKSELKQIIRNSLLSLHEHPEGVAILQQLGAKRFVPTSQKDYQPVIDLANEAGLNINEYNYYNP